MKREELPVVDKGAIAEAAFTGPFMDKPNNGLLHTSLVKESLDVLGSIGPRRLRGSTIFYHVQSDYKTEKADIGYADVCHYVHECMGPTEAANLNFPGFAQFQTERKRPIMSRFCSP